MRHDAFRRRRTSFPMYWFGCLREVIAALMIRWNTGLSAAETFDAQRGEEPGHQFLRYGGGFSRRSNNKCSDDQCVVVFAL